MTANRLIRNITPAALAMLSAGTLIAAEPVGEIVAIQGTMMVTQQDRYVITGGHHPIHVGDRVFMLEGGRAAIWYADSCEYFLFDDVVLDVTEQSPCAAGRGGQYRADIAEVEAATQPLEAATEAAASSEASGTAVEGVGDRLAAATRIEPSVAQGSAGIEASPSVTTTTTSVAVTTGVTASSWLPAALLGAAIGSAALSDFQGNIKTREEEEPISRIE
ncbi:hypothetical protein [Thiocapsa imhoffii]|nr:hypothetical protein [Thiocapsa imhoffii]